MLKRLALLVVVILVVTGTAAMAMPRPFIAAIIGGSCTGEICTDAPARMAEAQALYEDALLVVAASVAPLKARPLVAFCASEGCYRSFGFSDASAKSVGSALIVIGPRAWKPHYVRHEFIHRIQAQELGALRMVRQPPWWVEGMAYSLSGDPRHPLGEPFETYRTEFDAWYRDVGAARLWEASRALP